MSRRRSPTRRQRTNPARFGLWSGIGKCMSPLPSITQGSRDRLIIVKGTPSSDNGGLHLRTKGPEGHDIGALRHRLAPGATRLCRDFEDATRSGFQRLILKGTNSYRWPRNSCTLSSSPAAALCPRRRWLRVFALPPATGGSAMPPHLRISLTLLLHRNRGQPLSVPHRSSMRAITRQISVAVSATPC